MLLAAGRQLARRGATAPASPCCAAAVSALAASLRAPPPPRRHAASAAAALPMAAAQTEVAAAAGGEMVEEVVEPREAVYDTFYDPNNRNFVIVTGNVGREPRFTTVTPRPRPGNPSPPEPVSLLTFSVGLAVPGRRPAGGGGGGQQRAGAPSSSSSSATDWLPIKAWGEVADAARGRVHRGTLLVVSGTLRTELEAPSSSSSAGGGGGGGASSPYGGGEDGGGQPQRTRAYIHAKSIGIVTRRPASAADAMAGDGQAGGGWGSPEPAQQQQQPFQQQQQPPQQQQPYQQQQYQQAAASASPPPPQDAAATGAPTDRASATELLWRDWAAHGAGNGPGWFDNRQRKRSGQGNARQPDFRRKGGPPPSFVGTAFEKMDALWIDSQSTPAWVMERL